MITINIQNKKLREVSEMVLNGGLVSLVFGRNYDDQVQVNIFTNNPEAAHELHSFMNSWKDKWFPNIVPTNTAEATKKAIDDDIPF